ncbi:Beta-centractin, partial [Caligus rogercresseyi]
EGVNFRTTAEFEIVRTIKERACYLASNPQKEEGLDTERHAYSLPDGSTLEIGPARFRAPEVLFRPDLIGEECEGLHETLVFSIISPIWTYGNGGSTLFKGFGDRLLSEVKKYAPKDIKIRISAPQERLYSTWIGGSILASLDTFKKMWVSKREYTKKDIGPFIGRRSKTLSSNAECTKKITKSTPFQLVVAFSIRRKRTTVLLP